MSRFLVTGAAGFIGSHVVDELVYRGHEVVVLDLLTYCGSMENLPADTETVNGLWPNTADQKQIDAALSRRPVVLVHGDVCNGVLVKSLVDHVDGVFHLAAESHVDRSLMKTGPFVTTNVIGTHAVLEAARNTSKRILAVSTDEVYGAQPEGSVQESEKLCPRNPYSTLKAAGDLLAQTYASVFDVNVVIARPSNTYGPRQYPEKLVPKTIACFLTGKKMHVYGDGKHVRDWLWVEDNARALVDLYEKGRTGQAYNIAPHEYRTTIEVIEAIGRLLGVEWWNQLEYVVDRVRPDVRYSMDASRISADTGWRHRIGFDEGIGKVVRHYVERRDALQPVFFR